MTQAAKNKLAYALVDLYCLLYTSKYGSEPMINKYKDKYGFAEIVDHLGFDRTKQVLEYYFQTPRAGHPINQFFNNYHELVLNMDKSQARAEELKAIREATKRRVEAVEQRRTENDQRSNQE